jgi:Mor family transcriptional regulator
MSSSDKRKHKTLTLTVKAEIIKKLDKGEKCIHLAKEYGVGRATIYDIRKIRKFVPTFSSNTSFSVIRRYLGPI